MARKSLQAGFTGDVAEEAGVGRARSAVLKARDEAGMVAAHAIDHPTVTGSAVLIVGLLGFAVGYMLGASGASHAGRRYH